MQSTINNRTMFCRDNLEILHGIDSYSIDLIYLDPPFNKKKVFTAPLGSSAEGASFTDIFRKEDIKEEWLQTIEEDNEKLHDFLQGVRNIDGRGSYNFCYLAYMAIRLIECQRVLKDTGSIYLHCDPTMSHYLKIVLDCVFSEKNFRNEIVWCYRGAGYPKNDFGKRHDIIFRYSKTRDYRFNLDDIREEYAEATKARFKHYIGNRRKSGDFGEQSLNPLGKHPDDWWQVQPIAPSAKERIGYPTQKPLLLLDRIIKSSSNEGDTVLDPFCGCATTCIAAERLHRQWIGIDISIKAYELVKERLQKEIAAPDNLLEFQNEIYFSTEVPKRTDISKEHKQTKWVYVISNIAYKGEYKVGIASNWQNRLNAYQTSDPNRQYKMEYRIQTTKYREVEKYIHTIFDNRHEWVRAELGDIIRAIQRLLGRMEDYTGCNSERKGYGNDKIDLHV